MAKYLWVLFVFMAIGALSACGSTSEDGDDPDEESNDTSTGGSDGDTDSDADTDTDSDVDGDTDGDADGDSEPLALERLVDGVLLVEGYDTYADDDELRAGFSRNTGGNTIELFLDPDHGADGTTGCRIEFVLNEPAYAGGNHLIEQDWTGADSLRFWLQPDGANRVIVIQFLESAGEYWEYKYSTTSAEPQTVTIPLSDFDYPPWYSSADGTMDLDHIVQFSLYMEGDATENGVVYVDQFEMIADDSESDTDVPDASVDE